MEELFENTLKVEIFKRPPRRKWSLSSNNRLTSEWKTKTTFALKRREFQNCQHSQWPQETRGKAFERVGIYLYFSRGQLCITTSSTRNSNINKVCIKKIAKKRTNFQHVEKCNSQSPYILQQLHNNYVQRYTNMR